MAAWEYFVSDLGEVPELWNRRLQNLGRAGWELVSTHERPDTGWFVENGSKGSQAGRTSLYAIFKRPSS